MVHPTPLQSWLVYFKVGIIPQIYIHGEIISDMSQKDKENIYKSKMEYLDDFLIFSRWRL